MSIPDDDNRVPTIVEFQTRLVAGKAALDAFFAHLTEAEFSAPSTETDWSPKDHLSHLAVWLHGMVVLLHKQPRYPAMGLTEAQGDLHYDEVNALIYHQHKDDTPEAVRTYFENTHAAMVAVVNTMTDADLMKDYSEFVPGALPDAGEPSPVIWRMVGNSFAHYTEHIPWMEAWLLDYRNTHS